VNKFLEKGEMLFAAGLLIGFFLPWASYEGLVSFSGYNISEVLKGFSVFEGGFSKEVTQTPIIVYLLYLIPMLSMVIIIMGFKDLKTKSISIATAVVPFIALIYSLVEFGNIFKAVSIGFYISIISALCLFLSAMGIIKFKKTEK
jgi:hypothetical protein